MNLWCRHEVHVTQRSVKESLQQHNYIKTLMNMTPIAQIQKLIRTPHPRPDQVKDLLNHKFKIYHLQGKQRSQDAGHLCVTVKAELDSDIYAWLQDLQYYGFQANYIALFFDDARVQIIGKIHLKCPDYPTGHKVRTIQTFYQTSYKAP